VPFLLNGGECASGLQVLGVTAKHMMARGPTEYTSYVPIQDLQSAAQSIGRFLDLLVTQGRMRLRYRIVAGEGAADPDGLEEREMYVELSGPDTPLLTERNGELLRAIEHVAAKVLQLENEEHDKVCFDADNFKALRAQELRMRAQTAVDTVERTGQPFAFAPSNSRERRLMHLALRAFAAVETASWGEGAARVLVVYPAGYDRATYVPPPVAPRSSGRDREGFGGARRGSPAGRGSDRGNDRGSRDRRR
jgi:spoIIIJ-associated protein